MSTPRRERNRPQDEAGRPAAVMLALFALCFALPAAIGAVFVRRWAPGYQDGGLSPDGWFWVGIYSGGVTVLCAIPFLGAWWLRRRIGNEQRFVAAKWVRLTMLTSTLALAIATIWIGVRITKALQAPAIHLELLTEAQLREAAFSGEPSLRVRVLRWGEQERSLWADEAMMAALDAEHPAVRRRAIQMFWGLGWLTNLRAAFPIVLDSRRMARAINALEHDGPLQRDLLGLMKRQVDERHADVAHVVTMVRWVGAHGRAPVPSRERVRVCEAIVWLAARDLHRREVFTEFEALMRIDDLHDELHVWVNNCLTKQSKRDERTRGW